jgi:hypothetical protein
MLLQLTADELIYAFRAVCGNERGRVPVQAAARERRTNAEREGLVSNDTRFSSVLWYQAKALSLVIARMGPRLRRLPTLPNFSTV